MLARLAWRTAAAALMAMTSLSLSACVTASAFQTVKEDKVYRGGQPEYWDWWMLSNRYDIKTVVNFRPWDESGGEWAEDEQDAWKEYGMKGVHLPMRDTSVPTKEQADTYMTVIRDPANYPVYVHCKRGKDRTGTMIALYRIHVQGWSVDKAIKELREIDGGDPLNEGVDEFLRTYKPPPATQPDG